MKLSPSVAGNLKTARVKVCQQCDIEFITLWSRQLYCDECRPSRGKTTADRGVASFKVARPFALERIASERGKQHSTVADLGGAPEYAWSLTYSVPFSNDALKNRRWSNNGAGTVYLTDSVRRYSRLVEAETRDAITGRQIAHNKLWLSFLVEKPNHKIDAVNVVDTLCDAIKVAVGLDDRWFCIGKVDWCIKKTEPSIIIRLAQEATSDVLVCSSCGELRPPDDFSRNKAGPLGRSRVCRDCKSIHAEEARKARAV